MQTLLLEYGVKSSYFIAFGVNEGSLRFAGDDISGLLGKWQELSYLLQAVRLPVPQLFPEFLDEIHVCPLVFLHAALRNAGHISSQGAIDENTQHVQDSSEELAVGQKIGRAHV